MNYNNFVQMPTLAALRAALVYDPENSQQPLRCQSGFERHEAGELLGFQPGGIWLVQIGGGSTYLRNIVWRVVEGTIPSGFKVTCNGSINNNRIVNLRLVNKDGVVRWPKSVAVSDRIVVKSTIRPDLSALGYPQAPTMSPAGIMAVASLPDDVEVPWYD